MSLVRAELRRLFRRRLTRWMLALVMVLMATVAVVMGATNQKPGPAAVAQAEAEAAEQYRLQQESLAEEIDACEQAQAAGEAQAGRWPEDCEQIREWYGSPSQEEMVEWFMPPAFEFRDEFPEMITVFAGLLGLFGFLVGASFVGVEWRTGGMMNLLLWRPRRLRVVGAKLGTLLGALLGLGVVLGAAWTGMFWLVATFRGVTDTMTAGAWQSFGLAGARGVTLVLVAGAIGFALASIGRHTAMAMGTAIAAFVVGVAGAGIIVSMLQVRFPEAWLWTTYVYAWMTSSVELEDWSACTGGPGCEPATMEISWQTSGIAIGALVAVLVVAALWLIRRRDVT